MIRELRNADLISLGVALVATSKSFGVRLTSRSRTHPPTRYALYPARVSLRTTRSASGSIASRSKDGIERAVSRGPNEGQVCEVSTLPDCSLITYPTEPLSLPHQSYQLNEP